jgi:hypothetical protein
MTFDGKKNNEEYTINKKESHTINKNTKKHKIESSTPT